MSVRNSQNHHGRQSLHSGIEHKGPSGRENKGQAGPRVVPHHLTTTMAHESRKAAVRAQQHAMSAPSRSLRDRRGSIGTGGPVSNLKLQFDAASRQQGRSSSSSSSSVNIPNQVQEADRHARMEADHPRHNPRDDGMRRRSVPPLRPSGFEYVPMAAEHQAEAARMKERANALDAWNTFCRHEDVWTPACEGRSLRSTATVRPNAMRDVAALTQLIAVANERARLPRTDPDYRAPGTLDRLFNAYEKWTLGLILRNDVFRTAETVRALLEEGKTDKQVEQACIMSLIRDGLAQGATSTVGYVGSFFTFNSFLLHFMETGQPPSVQGGVPPLAHTAASLLGQRFVRYAEMQPGWTRPVGESKSGDTLPAILTDEGWWKVFSQYWPFFIPLLYASFNLTDSKDRVKARLAGGFGASLGVAAHRMTTLRREFVCLDGTTPLKSMAMMAWIDETTGVMNSLLAALKYVTARPAAGAAGLIGVDLHKHWHRIYERMTGVSQQAKDAAPWPEQPELAGYFENFTNTLKRAADFYLPMLVFGSARAYANDFSDVSVWLNAGNDALLLGGWGVAMADQEKIVATDPGISRENKWRGERQVASLARRYKARPSPAQSGPIQVVVQQPPVAVVDAALPQQPGPGQVPNQVDEPVDDAILE